VILDSAESLFFAKTYSQTTIADVAKRANVAVTTVYGSVGNKAEIVLALLERGRTDPVIQRTTSQVEQSSDAHTAVAMLAAGVCESIQKLLPLVTVMYDTAAIDPSIAEAVAATEASYRRNLAPLVHHLRQHDWLKSDLSDADALDILWFYFGISSLRTLHAAGWAWERTEKWLTQQAAQALLA
jgi:AcrR family transcriptional regulator